MPQKQVSQTCVLQGALPFIFPTNQHQFGASNIMSQTDANFALWQNSASDFAKGSGFPSMFLFLRRSRSKSYSTANLLWTDKEPERLGALRQGSACLVWSQCVHVQQIYCLVIVLFSPCVRCCHLVLLSAVNMLLHPGHIRKHSLQHFYVLLFCNFLSQSM